MEYDSSVNFAEYYGINPQEYEDDPVTSLPFSVRAIKRFMGNNITTVAELLRTTPATLMSLRGFGKNCLDEVATYCSQLSSNDSVKGNYSADKTMISSFAAHLDEIAIGDFSAFSDKELSDTEAAQLQKYKDAYDILGEELVFDSVVSPENIIPIIEMCTEYQRQRSSQLELQMIADALPGDRRSKIAQNYIKAFTSNEKMRASLMGICKTDESPLAAIIEASKLGDPLIYQQVKKFLKWCNFNLEDEIGALFSKIYSNDRDQMVIQSRAKGKTLEQIGTILGVTRERIRQIEARVKKTFSKYHRRIRIISKISAERNGASILTPSEIEEYCGRYTSELLFLLRSYESVNYTYDAQLDVFILGDDSISGRVQNIMEILPDIVSASQVDDLINTAAEDADVPVEIATKAFMDAYRLTGDVYHRSRLSLAAIYERVLNVHYPHGIKAYDSEELRHFREIIANEYGDVGIPTNDRAITARVSSICILCGKGMYRPKRKDYLPKQLASKICDYIENSENTIFLTNTLFHVFEEELLSVGIDNKYFLQGVLHELFSEKFVFKRDYISKDAEFTSVYSSIVEFIKKSKFPVSKPQIAHAFPGITDIVINFSVSDHNILNYFGSYLHASNLEILNHEKDYIVAVLEKLVSDNEAHHGKEIYEIISKDYPEILTRNAAMYPFSTFSIVEYLCRDKFQFSRPYVAKKGIDIGRPGERLHDLIYSSDEFTVSDISDFAKENHFQINSILEYVNGCNDEFLLINENTLMRIDRTGIDEAVAFQVEDIISSSISETTPIKELAVWAQLPRIKISWTDWLIYSIIYKWGTKLLAVPSNNQFRLAVPLVAPIESYDPAAFKGVGRSEASCSFVADDLSNIDSLLEDLMGDDFLDIY